MALAPRKEKEVMGEVMMHGSNAKPNNITNIMQAQRDGYHNAHDESKKTRGTNAM